MEKVVTVSRAAFEELVMELPLGLQRREQEPLEGLILEVVVPEEDRVWTVVLRPRE